MRRGQHGCGRVQISRCEVEEVCGRQPNIGYVDSLGRDAFTERRGESFT